MVVGRTQEEGEIHVVWSLGEQAVEADGGTSKIAQAQKRGSLARARSVVFGIDGEDGFVLSECPRGVGLVLRHQEVGVCHAGDHVAGEGCHERVEKGAGLGLTPEFIECLGQLQPGLDALGREPLGASERRQGLLIAPLPQVDLPERECGLVVQGIALDECFEHVGGRVQTTDR